MENNKKIENSENLSCFKISFWITLISSLFLEYLKVIHFIDWSWLLVFSPIIVFFGGIFELFIGAFIFYIKKNLNKMKKET